MVIKDGFSSDLFINNCLIHFYMECGCLHLARRVFMTMPKRDVVSWNSMINGLTQNDCVDEALELFRRMEGKGVKPNDVTVVAVLSACGQKLDVEFGKWLHCYVEENEIQMGLILSNAILDMYAKCGNMDLARKCFDKMLEKDIISWTTMLAGYAKLGDFDAATDLFNLAPCKDIAIWNALISAYAQSGKPKEALDLFNELQLTKAAKPDEVTLVSALAACSQLGAMELGGWIHAYIHKECVMLNCHLITALVDMYSKCGDLEKALQVFHSVDKRDVFVWSAMIAGLGMHGCGRDAIQLFLLMQKAKVKPSAVTFTNLLSACSHSGLVKEGQEVFHHMEHTYKILPGMEHYACMVDILGRAGRLEAAIELIKNMPMNPGPSVWGALLGACRLHKNVDLAEQAAKNLLEIEPDNDGAYVLLSNVYANSGKWNEVSKLRKRMRDAGLKKEPGCSSVEVNGVMHDFLVGDNRHPISERIYLKLDEIASQVKSMGYASDKSQVLQLVEEENLQEKALYLHSERLAVAYGLLTLAPSQPIRIVKNLRVCQDCHSVVKLVSKLYDREIVLRDRYRFHHFKGGCCSCNDYW